MQRLPSGKRVSSNDRSAALWRNEGVFSDPSPADWFSREAAFLVRAGSGELAGVCILPLVQAENGRIFYEFGLFLRRQNRVPNLMVKIVVATRGLPAGLPPHRVSTGRNPVHQPKSQADAGCTRPLRPIRLPLLGKDRGR